MLSNYISRKLGRIDPDEFNAYRTVIPNTVFVHFEKEGNKQIITIKSIDDKKVDDLLISEAKNNEEALDVINDLVLMYKNVPELYRPYFKRILTPQDGKSKQKDHTLVKS